MAEKRTCPVEGIMEIDFNSEPFLTEFKELYMQMHDSGCPYAHSSVGDHYAVASHGQIMKMLRDYDMWSSKFGPGLGYQEGEGVLVSVDPPQHTFEVKIVANAFSASYFQSLAPEIEEFVSQQIASFYKQGQVDLHEALSVKLPLFVIFRMLGIPLVDEQGDKTQSARDSMLAGVGLMMKPADLITQEIIEGTISLEQTTRAGFIRNMFVSHLAVCKEKLKTGEFHPDSNIVCRFLTTAGDDGTYLSDEKILGFCSFLLIAGSGTTTITLSNLIYRLLSEPAEYAKLQADPSLIPLAIEETLRLDSPVQGLFRTNNRETDLGPIHLKQDSKVILLWAAANLDPDVFSDPLKFSLDRDLAKVKRHLSFGYGLHFCRGAVLARLEAEIFLRLVRERLPNLRLAGEVLPEKRMPVLQGIRALPVAWDVA